MDSCLAMDRSLRDDCLRQVTMMAELAEGGPVAVTPGVSTASLVVST